MTVLHVAVQAAHARALYVLRLVCINIIIKSPDFTGSIQLWARATNRENSERVANVPL